MFIFESCHMQVIASGETLPLWTNYSPPLSILDRLKHEQSIFGYFSRITVRRQLCCLMEKYVPPLCYPSRSEIGHQVIERSIFISSSLSIVRRRSVKMLKEGSSIMNCIFSFHSSSDVELELNCSWSSGMVYYHHVMDSVLKREIDTASVSIKCEEENEEKAQCQCCRSRSFSEARLESLSTGGRRQTIKANRPKRKNITACRKKHTIKSSISHGRFSDYSDDIRTVSAVDNELQIGRGQGFYSGLFDLEALGGLDESVLFLPSKLTFFSSILTSDLFGVCCALSLHQPPDRLQLISKYLINRMDLCGISDSKCKQRLQKRHSRLDNISNRLCPLVLFSSARFWLRKLRQLCQIKYLVYTDIMHGVPSLKLIIICHFARISEAFCTIYHKPTNLIKVDRVVIIFQLLSAIAPMQRQRGTV
ncbi:hypothetical protein T07_1576 [Trichinella nelsoni]|uniref:Uncharacterized protein n=1 Tax=Trichinella nelsoni TaxID=6336 RepID=A0A0V0SMU4_9BILA|nr:hypothetical protein T07_1576 [Trichinella nelsoni]